MTLKEQIMKLQTYKMFEGEDTVYVERDDVIKALEQQPCEDAISREEAIDALRDAENHAFNSYYKGLIAAHKIIANLPSVTPKILEPCEDAVSREEAIKIVNDMLMGEANHKIKALEQMQDLPSVTPKSKMGHWIEEEMFDGDVAYKCSECGELFWLESGTPKDNKYNFCPKCGARMAESEG